MLIWPNWLRKSLFLSELIFRRISLKMANGLQRTTIADYLSEQIQAQVGQPRVMHRISGRPVNLAFLYPVQGRKKNVIAFLKNESGVRFLE